MKPRTPCTLSARTLLGILAGGLVMTGPTLAQEIYRIVGPDGRVSYSSQAPATNEHARPLSTARTASGASSAAAQLPFALRQIASRYPVTLYSGPDCSPCELGRHLLKLRGIPYTEKTITTEADQQALKKLSGQASLPVLSIGSQQIKGFSNSEWTEFLNAAGYPKQSALPPSYQAPAASPLAPSKPSTPAAPAPNAAEQASPSATTPAPAARRPPAPPRDQPAGIRF